MNIRSLHATAAQLLHAVPQTLCNIIYSQNLYVCILINGYITNQTASVAIELQFYNVFMPCFVYFEVKFAYNL